MLQKTRKLVKTGMKDSWSHTGFSGLTDFFSYFYLKFNIIIHLRFFISFFFLVLTTDVFQCECLPLSNFLEKNRYSRHLLFDCLYWLLELSIDCFWNRQVKLCISFGPTEIWRKTIAKLWFEYIVFSCDYLLFPAHRFMTCYKH